jgi:hypothetical protein
MWTPLHQAVFSNAPVEKVNELIQMGAYREHTTTVFSTALF